MHLHEEYIKRRQLKIPLIRYDSRSVALLKSEEEWRIIDISWVSCHWHPGHFVIRVLMPRHDKGGSIRVFPNRELYWDQYEDHILELKDTWSGFHAIPKKESSLAWWYVFLLMYDSSLAQLSFDFRELVAASIDPDSEFLDKKIAAKRAQLQMRIEDICLEEAWSGITHDYSPKYADWLVNLIND